MTKINKNTNASYNFKAPEIARDADKKVEALFPVSEVKSVSIESNQAEFDIDRQVLVINVGETSDSFLLAGNAIKESLNYGAILLVKGANSGGAAIDVVPQGDLATGDIAVPAGELFNLLFIYDGTQFTHYNPKGASTETGGATETGLTYEELSPTLEAGVAKPVISKNTTLIILGTLTENVTLEPETDPVLSPGDKVIVYAGNGSANTYGVYFAGAMEGTDLLGEMDYMKTATFIYTEAGTFIKIAEAIVSVPV